MGESKLTTNTNLHLGFGLFLGLKTGLTRIRYYRGQGTNWLSHLLIIDNNMPHYNIAPSSKSA